MKLITNDTFNKTAIRRRLNDALGMALHGAGMPEVAAADIANVIETLSPEGITVTLSILDDTNECYLTLTNHDRHERVESDIFDLTEVAGQHSSRIHFRRA